MHIFSEIKEAKRLEQITRVLLKHELGHILNAIKIKSVKGARPKVITPDVIKNILQDLGGSFIKFGQFLSLRPDLIPQKFCEKLSLLQDQVPPFPTEEAKKIVELQLAKKIKSVFIDFSEKPIAAASIGQVHKATLKNGNKVAVKVMRPGIRELFTTDILILYRLATLIDKHIKIKIINPLKIVDEFRHYTESELNYLGEMQALQVASNNFKGIKKVKIPTPYKEFSTEHILTMEFLDGTPLRRATVKLSRKQKKDLADELAHITLKQIFIDGFFHADMHPGNIFIMKNHVIGVVDFGIVGVIDQHTKKQLIVLNMALLNKDVESLVEAMGGLGFYTHLENPQKLKEDLAITLGPYYSVALEKMDVAEIFMQSLNVARENNLVVPTNLILLAKTIMTLKGVVQTLDPDFNMVAVMKPFMGELMRKESSIHNMLKQATTRGVEFSNFLIDLPKLTKDYFYTAKAIEEDIHHLGDEITLLNRSMRAVGHEFLHVILLIVFAALTVIFWDKSPFYLGFSIMSALCLLITLIFTFKFISATRGV